MSEEIKEVNETIEEATVTEQDVEVANPSMPLVPGFKNKTVVLPLGILQRRIENFEKNVQGGFESLQKQSNQQIQYVFQYLSQVAGTANDMRVELKAICKLLNITDESLANTVKTVKEEEAIATEKAEDEKQKRVTVDREAKEGDVVKISYIGTIEGKEFEGGKGENFHLTLGSKRFIPGFEEQLIGSKAGEVKNVIVSFPADYNNKKLAGKEAAFATVVHAVKEIQKAE